MPATMAASLFRCSEAGVFRPAEACTIDIEFFDRDRLWASFLAVDFGAPKAGKNEGFAAVDKMTTVELSGDLNREAQVPHGARGCERVRRRSGEIAAKPDKSLGVSPLHRLDRADDVAPVRSGRLESKCIT